MDHSNMNGTPTRSSLSKCRKTLFEFNTTNLEQLNYDMQKLDLKENEANNERREERKVIHKNKIQKMKAEEPCQVSKRLAAIRKRYQETLPNQIRRQQIRRNINPMREVQISDDENGNNMEMRELQALQAAVVNQSN